MNNKYFFDIAKKGSYAMLLDLVVYLVV